MAGTDISFFVETITELNKRRPVPKSVEREIDTKRESILLKKLFTVPPGLNADVNKTLHRELLKYIHETKMDRVLIDYMALSETYVCNIDLTNTALLSSLCRVPILYMLEAIESDSLFVKVSILSTFNHVFLMEKDRDCAPVDLSHYPDYGHVNIPAGLVLGELDRIRRRFLLLKGLRESLLDVKYHRLHTHIGNIIRCLMVILCKRVVSIIDSASAVSEEGCLFDVSFLIPHLVGMPRDLFTALSNKVIEHKVTVKCTHDRKIAKTMFTHIENTSNSTMWAGRLGETEVRVEGYSFCRLELPKDMFTVDYTHCILTEAVRFLDEHDGINNVPDWACEIETYDSSTSNFLFQMFKHLSDFKWIGTVISSWKLPAYTAFEALNMICNHTEMYSEQQFTFGNSQMLFCGHVLKRALEEDTASKINDGNLLKTLMYVARGTIESNVQPALFESLIKKCKDCNALEVLDVKSLALYCLDIVRDQAKIIEILIDEYKWIPKTWLSEEGNTLLGIIVAHGKLARNILPHGILSRKHVLDSIDMPSRYDHMTPLMIAADYNDDDRVFGATVLVKHGCNVSFVNKNKECVLHRAACFNNYTLIEKFVSDSELKEYTERLAGLVDLRRDVDGTTPFMIALARNHIEFAASFYNLYHPKVKILMGKSVALGIYEYMTLASTLSRPVQFLRLKGHSFDIRGINNAIDTIPGYSLGMEYVTCGGSGLKTEGGLLTREIRERENLPRIVKMGELTASDYRFSPRRKPYINDRGEITRKLGPQDIPTGLPYTALVNCCSICSESKGKCRKNLFVCGNKHIICLTCVSRYRLDTPFFSGCVICEYKDIIANAATYHVSVTEQEPVFEKESTHVVIPSEEILYKEMPGNKLMLYIDGEWKHEHDL